MICVHLITLSEYFSFSLFLCLFTTLFTTICPVLALPTPAKELLTDGGGITGRNFRVIFFFTLLLFPFKNLFILIVR